VFNLLGLALEREPVRISALAFESDDAYLRGTALEYLETVLPTGIYSALRPHLAAKSTPALKSTPASKRREPEAVRARLLDAAATMQMTRDQVRRQLGAELNDEG
jgi:hypothetical protein